MPLAGGLNGDRPGVRPGVAGDDRAEIGPAPRAEARPGVEGGARSATPDDFPGELSLAGAGAGALVKAAECAAACAAAASAATASRTAAAVASTSTFESAALAALAANEAFAVERAVRPPDEALEGGRKGSCDAEPERRGTRPGVAATAFVSDGATPWEESTARAEGIAALLPEANPTLRAEGKAPLRADGSIADEAATRLSVPSFAKELTQPRGLCLPAMAIRARFVPSGSCVVSRMHTFVPAERVPASALSSSQPSRILSLLLLVRITCSAKAEGPGMSKPTAAGRVDPNDDNNSAGASAGLEPRGDPPPEAVAGGADADAAKALFEDDGEDDDGGGALRNGDERGVPPRGVVPRGVVPRGVFPSAVLRAVRGCVCSEEELAPRAVAGESACGRGSAIVTVGTVARLVVCGDSAPPVCPGGALELAPDALDTAAEDGEERSTLARRRAVPSGVDSAAAAVTGLASTGSLAGVTVVVDHGTSTSSDIDMTELRLLRPLVMSAL